MKKKLFFTVNGKRKASEDITDADIEKGSRLTPKELKFINDTTRKVIGSGHRNLVLLALMSSIAGCVVRGSDGSLDKKLVVKWIGQFMQI